MLIILGIQSSHLTCSANVKPNSKDIVIHFQIRRFKFGLVPLILFSASSKNLSLIDVLFSVFLRCVVYR